MALHYEYMSPPLNEFQKEAVEQLYTGYEQTHRATKLVGLAMSACSAVLPFLLCEDKEAALGIAALIFLVAALILSLVLKIMDSCFLRRVRALPEMATMDVPDEAHRAFLVSLDEAYRQKNKSFRNSQGIILLVGMLMGLLPIAILVLIIRKNHFERKHIQPDSAERVIRAQTEAKSKPAGCGLMLCSIGCGACMVLYSMFGFVASGKRMTYQTNARQIWDLTATYQTELEETGQTPQLETVIWRVGDEPPAGSVQEYIRRNGCFSSNEWYAIVCDDDGNLLYTLYSRSQITDLTRQTDDELRALLASPFPKKPPVGSYTPNK